MNSPSTPLDPTGVHETETKCDARYEEMLRDCGFARDALEQVEDPTAIRSWLLEQKDHGPEPWLQAQDSVTENSKEADIMSVLDQITPIEPNEATEELDTFIKEFKQIIVSARNSSAASSSSQAPNFTDVIHDKMVELNTALLGLDGEDEVEGSKGGKERLKALIKNYAKDFGLDSEWQPGEEYTNSDITQRAMGFYELLINLAHAVPANKSKERKQLKEFVTVLKNWQKPHCHNIVVNDLRNAIPR